MGPDILLVLVIVLIVVVIWRGPKTLPLLGRAFGQGVKEARKEMSEMKAESDTKSDKGDKSDKDEPAP